MIISHSLYFDKAQARITLNQIRYFIILSNRAFLNQVTTFARKSGLKDVILTAYHDILNKRYHYIIYDNLGVDFNIITNVRTKEHPPLVYLPTD